MKRTRNEALLLATLISTCIALASCGSSGGSGPGDTTPPGIDETSIQDGAMDVSLCIRAEATFDSPMDAGTVNEGTFYLEERTVSGQVDYDAQTRTAGLTPDTLLVANAIYRLLISDAIEDKDGTPLPETVTIDFETGDFDCDGIADYMEPNGDVLTAPSIELNRWYRTLTLCEDDRDYFSFSLEETAKVWINARARHTPGVHWRVTFQTADGVDYYTSTYNPAQGDTTRCRYTFLPGTYAVGVYSVADPMYFLYDFMLGTDEPCPDDDWEDNDFINQAPTITEGTIENLVSCYSDYDWFAVYLEEGETVTVTMDVEDPGPAWVWSVDIYNPDESYLEGELGTSDPMTVNAVAETDGTHYIRTSFVGEGSLYSLDIEITD